MPAGSRIVAMGHYQPARVLTNEDLSKMVETNDEWIVQRTGIRERRIAGPEESTATLAAKAAERAIAAAGISAKEIDLIICATATPEMVFPSTACFVAAYAEKRELSVLDVAIAGLAAQPMVGSVIAGVTSGDQVRANAAAMRWEPTEADLVELDEITS